MSLHQLWQKLLDWQSNSARPQSSQAFTESSQARLRRNRPRRLFESLEQRRFMAADLGFSPDSDSVEPSYDTIVSDDSQLEIQDNSLVQDTDLQWQVPLLFWFNFAEPVENPLDEAEKSEDPLENADPIFDPLDFAEPLEDPLDNAEKSQDPLDDAEPLEDPLDNAEQSQDPLENADPLDP
jgi:hypothetical protein